MPDPTGENYSNGNQEADLNGFPTLDLTGQVALVTGAARGLGNAISLALAHAGADVALGLRDVNARGDLAGSDRSHGSTCYSATDGRQTP